MARSDISEQGQPTPMDHLLGAPLLGRLLVLPTNIRPNLKFFPGTNALAFLVNWWAYLSGSPIRCSLLGVVFTKLHFLLNLWFGPISQFFMTLEERLAKDKHSRLLGQFEVTKKLKCCECGPYFFIQILGQAGNACLWMIKLFDLFNGDKEKSFIACLPDQHRGNDWHHTNC